MSNNYSETVYFLFKAFSCEFLLFTLHIFSFKVNLGIHSWFYRSKFSIFSVYMPRLLDFSTYKYNMLCHTIAWFTLNFFNNRLFYFLVQWIVCFIYLCIFFVCILLLLLLFFIFYTVHMHNASFTLYTHTLF